MTVPAQIAASASWEWVLDYRAEMALQRGNIAGDPIDAWGHGLTQYPYAMWTWIM